MSVSKEPEPLQTDEETVNALALILKPIRWGWAVMLTDGRELVRFTGLGARRRALRYLAATH
jgi:hypothetical protein